MFVCIMYVCMSICPYVWMYVLTCVCMYVCIDVCMDGCMYVCMCMYVYMYVCIYVCMYICMYVYVYACIYIYNLLSACPITLAILHACRIRLQQVLFFYMNCYCSVCVVGCSYYVCMLTFMSLFMQVTWPIFV